MLFEYSILAPSRARGTGGGLVLQSGAAARSVVQAISGHKLHDRGQNP